MTADEAVAGQVIFALAMVKVARSRATSSRVVVVVVTANVASNVYRCELMKAC